MIHFEFRVLTKISLQRLVQIVILATIFSISQALVYRCTYRMQTFQVTGEIYICDPSIIELGDSRTVTLILGIHISGKGDPDVEGIFTVNHNTTRLPTNLETFFSNIRLIFWHVSELNTITADDLRPYPRLQVLSIFDSRLVSLDGDLFEQTQNLRLIEFKTGQLQHVGHNLLANLPQLEMVLFTDHPCINREANTPDEIQVLNYYLSTECPPLSPSPEPEECSTGCLDIFEQNGNEIEALKAQIKLQNELTEELRAYQTSLREDIDAQARLQNESNEDVRAFKVLVLKDIEKLQQQICDISACEY